MVKTRAGDKQQAKGRKRRFFLFVLCLAAICAMVTFREPQVQADDILSGNIRQPEVRSSFSRGIQGLLGVNRFAAWMGARQLKKQIAKKVNGDIDVKLKPYSGLDLMDGKARSLRIRGRNLLYDNAFYVSRFELRTDDRTPIWVSPDNGNLKSAVAADVEILIRDSDLNRSLQTNALRKSYSSIKVDLVGAGRQTFSLVEPRVQFKPERILLNTKVTTLDTPDGKMLPLTIETGLEPEPATGLIRFKNLDIAPIPGVPDLAFMENTLEKVFHKILQPHKLIPMESGKVEVRSLRIAREGLHLRGRIILLPTDSSQT